MNLKLTDFTLVQNCKSCTKCGKCLNRVSNFFNDPIISIVFNTQTGPGYAEVYKNDSTGTFRSVMYQDRLDMSYNNDSDMIQHLSDTSKTYIDDNHSLKDALNSVLNFWCLGPKENIPVLFTDSVKSTIEKLVESNLDYIVCMLDSINSRVKVGLTA